MWSISLKIEPRTSIGLGILPSRRFVFLPLHSGQRRLPHTCRWARILQLFECSNNNSLSKWDIILDTNDNIFMRSLSAPTLWVGANITWSKVPVPWRLIPADNKFYSWVWFPHICAGGVTASLVISASLRIWIAPLRIRECLWHNPSQASFTMLSGWVSIIILLLSVCHSPFVSSQWLIWRRVTDGKCGSSFVYRTIRGEFNLSELLYSVAS